MCKHQYLERGKNHNVDTRDMAMCRMHNMGNTVCAFQGTAFLSWPHISRQDQRNLVSEVRISWGTRDKLVQITMCMGYEGSGIRESSLICNKDYHSSEGALMRFYCGDT